MEDASKHCSREILETVPLVMQFIREQVRQRRAAALSLPHFRTLSFLCRVNEASLSAAAYHLGLSLPAMSRLINTLVAARLVTRQTVATNRRQIALSVTARGRTMVEQVRGDIRGDLVAALKTIPAAEYKTILRAMHLLHGVFGRQTVAGTRPRDARPD
jgi:DNA-binding MarR family transcriptional regulator